MARRFACLHGHCDESLVANRFEPMPKSAEIFKRCYSAQCGLFTKWSAFRLARVCKFCCVLILWNIYCLEKGQCHTCNLGWGWRLWLFDATFTALVRVFTAQKPVAPKRLTIISLCTANIFVSIYCFIVYKIILSLFLLLYRCYFRVGSALFQLNEIHEYKGSPAPWLYGPMERTWRSLWWLHSSPSNLYTWK